MRKGYNKWSTSRIRESVDWILERCAHIRKCPYEDAAEYLQDSDDEDYAVAQVNCMHSLRIVPHPSGIALLTAMLRGVLKIAKRLIELKLCDPLTARDGFDATIVHHAARSGSLECLAEAIRLAPTLVCVGDVDGELPIIYPVLRGRVQCARMLLEHGSPVEYRSWHDQHMRHALSMGSDNYYECGWEMAKLLFAHGGRLFKSTYKELDSPQRRYFDKLCYRLRSCDHATMAILGLGRSGGNIQSNGRDALRLVARMVWVYRVDESWDDLIWDDVGQAKKKRYKK